MRLSEISHLKIIKNNINDINSISQEKMTEANARIVIDKLLRESDWILPGDDGVVNVDTEMQTNQGSQTMFLKDENDFPICIIEAKKELISPLVGKEQARGYADSLNCRFAILSNGVSHYFWDLKQGNPMVVDILPTQEQLILRTKDFNPSRDNTEAINIDYIAQTQLPNFDKNPDYLDENKREEFIRNNKLTINFVSIN